MPAALGLVLACWSLLLAAAALAPRLGGPVFCAAFAAGGLLAWITRPASRRPRPARGLALLAAGLAAGFAAYPACALGIAHLGLGLGLAPGGPDPGPAPPWLWLAAVLLAPPFEELVYRERLLAALEPRLGALPGLLLSSAAFALPHLEPWSLLGTFLVGLLLGAAMQIGRAVSLCIGLHAGLNAGVLALGVPAPGAAAPSALAGAALLAAALMASRSSRSGRRPRPGPPR